VIAKVKTPRIKDFFISLERYWNVNVWNGLAWPVWTFATQVMAKRKVRSQIGSLTPDHKKSGIDLTPMCADGVRYTVGKFSTRATTLLQTSSQLEVWARTYGLAKLRESNLSNFRTPLWGSRDKKAIWMWALRRGAKNTIWGKVVAFPEFGAWWVLWVQSHPWLILTSKVL